MADNMVLDGAGSQTRVVLPVQFHREGVESARESLMAALKTALGGEQTLVLEGDAVERVDTMAIQLLLAFAQEAGQAHIAWSWAAQSQPLSDGIQQLGLEGPLAGGR